MKALLVEDVPVSIYILRNILERAGHRIVEAHSAEEALEALEAHPGVGVIFVDVHMPGMTGIELVERIREDPRHGPMPVVVVTGSGDVDTVRTAARLGCIGYLLKPVADPQRVHELMERAALARPPVCDEPDVVAQRLKIGSRQARDIYRRVVEQIEAAFAGRVDDPAAYRDMLAEVARPVGAARLRRALEADVPSQELDWEVEVLLSECRELGGASADTQDAAGI